MSRHACIAIGIDQYQALQPLRYASQDAWEFYALLAERYVCQDLHAAALREPQLIDVGAGGAATASRSGDLGDLNVGADGLTHGLTDTTWVNCSSIPCLLLTEHSPPIAGRNTYPTRENILQLLYEWNQRYANHRVSDGASDGAINGVSDGASDGVSGHVSETDYLWVFFSGYGMETLGVDYLLPIDADPQQLDATAIPIPSVIEYLAALPVQQVILVLDIHRPTAIDTHSELGHNTLQHARTQGVIAVLSCQPYQRSHETRELRHGIFTTALLEALRHGKCSTLESLDRYLCNRVPELCYQHGQPEQLPLTIVSDSTQLSTALFPFTDTPLYPSPSDTMTRFLQTDLPTTGNLDHPDFADRNLTEENRLADSNPHRTSLNRYSVNGINGIDSYDSDDLDDLTDHISPDLDSTADGFVTGDQETKEAHTASPEPIATWTEEADLCELDTLDTLLGDSGLDSLAPHLVNAIELGVDLIGDSTPSTTEILQIDPEGEWSEVAAILDDDYAKHNPDAEAIMYMNGASQTPDSPAMNGTGDLAQNKNGRHDPLAVIEALDTIEATLDTAYRPQNSADRFDVDPPAITTNGTGSDLGVDLESDQTASERSRWQADAASEVTSDLASHPSSHTASNGANLAASNTAASDTNNPTLAPRQGTAVMLNGATPPNTPTNPPTTDRPQVSPRSSSLWTFLSLKWVVWSVLVALTLLLGVAFGVRRSPQTDLTAMPPVPPTTAPGSSQTGEQLPIEASNQAGTAIDTATPTDQTDQASQADLGNPVTADGTANSTTDGMAGGITANPATNTAPSATTSPAANNGEPVQALGNAALTNGANAPDRSSPDLIAPMQKLQASYLAYAIAQARRIPSSDPGYATAQAKIQRWGETIWEIAQSRAQQGNWQYAIAAAQLVPRETANLHQQAQTAAQTWQQAAKNQEIFNTALANVQPGQASSYWRGIRDLKAIAPGQPLHTEAQAQIETWAQDILQLARDRAAIGQTQAATRSAQLVPRNTQAYAPAQTLLQQLQTQKPQKR